MPVNGKDDTSTMHACNAAGLQPAALARYSLCDAMARIHEAKIELCHRLEAIADSLPGAIDAGACLQVAQLLVPTLRQAHVFEENVIFPAYMAALKEETALASIRRLRDEHIEDECFAADLTETLLRLGHGGEVLNAESLGFMLRGFFDGLRRHVAFENEHVVPLIRVATRKLH